VAPNDTSSLYAKKQYEATMDDQYSFKRQNRTGLDENAPTSPTAANFKARAPVNIKRFLNLQNIQRYHRLLNVAYDEKQRQQILNLLEEEMLNQEELSKS
jgi:hypothetical protein